MPKKASKKKVVDNIIERYLNRGVAFLDKIPCPHFGVCGGCSFLNMPYENELELKKEIVAEVLQKSADIISAPSPEGYRNKMELSFGDECKDGALALGIRKRRQYYEVAVPSECAIIPKDFRDITVAVLEYFRQTTETFYHKMRRTGTLRYLVLRRGEFTGELLVNLVTTEALDRSLPDKLAKVLLDLPLEGKIVGIIHTVSNALADAVIPEEVRLIHGRSHFYEKICDLRFRISTFSFFQTYSGAAELLYRTVAEFAGKSNRVYDLYCGTGTIAQVLSPCANEIVGVELVEEAVEAAKENARANSINNCRFIAGDVLKLLDDMAPPDTLILDPPRDGIHPKALSKIIGLAAPKIVYVSCKPTSLARDLSHFTEAGYSLTDLRIHDMFPRTPHVECVALLRHKD